MDPQGPKAIAPRTSPAEPAAMGNEAPPPPVVREQDRLLPVANVSRIMRRALPPHAKVSDDAKEVIQDCVSEFISFITGEANDRCHNEHRKTVTAEDIVWAMSHLGFDDYVLPLNAFLQRMRETEGGGAGAGSGRGSRRGSSLLELHGVQTMMRPAAAAMYRHPHPAAPPPQHQQAAYAVVARIPRTVPVPVPGPASSAASHFGGRYQMPGGGQQQQRAMMISYYYGGPAAFQAEGSHGRYYADEASSSNEVPPRAGPRSR